MIPIVLESSAGSIQQDNHRAWLKCPRDTVSLSCASRCLLGRHVVLPWQMDGLLRVCNLYADHIQRQLGTYLICLRTLFFNLKWLNCASRGCCKLLDVVRSPAAHDNCQCTINPPCALATFGAGVMKALQTICQVFIVPRRKRPKI